MIQQIANQLNKLVDVVNVLDMTRGEHVERELVLLKLKVAPGETDAVRGHVVRSGGRVLDPATDGFIVELTASEAEVNGFVADAGSACRAPGSGAQRRARHLAQRPPAAGARPSRHRLRQRRARRPAAGFLGQWRRARPLRQHDPGESPCARRSCSSSF